MTDKLVMIRCEWGGARLHNEETAQVILGEPCENRAAWTLVDTYGKAKRLCDEHARYIRDLGILDPRSPQPEG